MPIRVNMQSEKAEFVPLRSLIQTAESMMNPAKLVALAAPDSKRLTRRNVMSRLHNMRLAALLVGLVSLLGCGEHALRGVKGPVLETRGTVFVSSTGSGQESGRLRDRPSVQAGDVIETGDDGQAAFALLPGALVLIEPGSKLRIEELKLGKNGFASAEGMTRLCKVKLDRGVLYALVQWESEPPAWKVTTAHGRLASGPAGICRIETDSVKTRIISARGDFTFVEQPSRHVSPVGAGYAHEWPLPAHDAFPAELDQQTLRDVQRTRDVEQKLLELQQRLQLTPYPWRRP